MKKFKLPDLGEGLPDAIIREWYVKEGDEVSVDQPMASMETAKALVDVPSPYAGKIIKLFGNPGDTIETGQPLVGFEGEEIAEKAKDAGTVVGAIEVSDTVLDESATGIAVAKTSTESRVKATPAVRALAKKLGVALENVVASGDRITLEDVQKAASKTTSTAKGKSTTSIQGEKLAPMRQAMLMNMIEAHQQVVPVTMSDDADIHAWNKDQDMTLRLIRAVEQACSAEPLLNAYFHAESMSYQTNKNINIGIAMDTPHGLYVPVLKDVVNRSDDELRDDINRLKQQAMEKSIRSDELHGATIMLSNFGSIAGRYGNPILLPPMVCIVGAGRSRDAVVAVNGEMVIHRIMPLSITADHRLVTGGEIARFLKVMMTELAKAS